MGNRCPDCNKFVGLEMGEPEINDLQIDGTTITAEVRLPLNCAECGSELMEYNFQLEEEVPDEAIQNTKEGTEFEVEEGDCESFDNYKSRKPPKINKKTGKPRPVPIRYQTHYYGVSLDVTVTCPATTDSWEVTLSDETEASSFDQLY